jgi:hypothetical protein
MGGRVTEVGQVCSEGVGLLGRERSDAQASEGSEIEDRANLTL